MTTSGIYTYSRTATELITASYRKCAMVSEGETITAKMLADGLEALEMMTRAWIAEGIHLWKYEEMILFLITSQQSYDIGPSGGNWVKKSDLTTTAMKL